MKIFRIIVLSLGLVLSLDSCKKESHNQWDVEVKNPAEQVVVTDISGRFYDQNIPLDQFKAEFPWFQGTVSDADFGKRRIDRKKLKFIRKRSER
jgi:hypothetical protein